MTPALDPNAGTPSAQQVFDAVVRHAAQMPEKSYDDEADTCLYRNVTSKGENACFVGALLTDAEAARVDPDKGEEPWDVKDLNDNGLLPAHLQPHVDLLMELQHVHDFSEKWDWRRRLARVAAANGLSADLLNKVMPS